MVSHQKENLSNRIDRELWHEVGKLYELDESASALFKILNDTLKCTQIAFFIFSEGESRVITQRGNFIQFPNVLLVNQHEQNIFVNSFDKNDLFFGSIDISQVGFIKKTTDVNDLNAVAFIVNRSPFEWAVLAFEKLIHTKTKELIIQCKEPLLAAAHNDVRLKEMKRTKEAVIAENQALLLRLKRGQIVEKVIGWHRGLHEVIERVEQVALTHVPVLLLGETGSGKEVIARAIHDRSPRKNGPMVRVNCGAIPKELIDSELFGHERGAFTGAIQERKGWFERADGGTLLLDEVGELSKEAQVRLLRVLQEGTLERVGGQKTIHVDARIIAATHRDLHSMVVQGEFREDLWYRLSVFPIRIPALRERPEDIPELALYFAEKAGKRFGYSALIPSAHDLSLLCDYPWPGNVRELAAVIDRAAILGNGKQLEIERALYSDRISNQPQVISQVSTSEAYEPKTLEEVIRTHIEKTLMSSHGRIDGPYGAAQKLGMNPHTLRSKMQKLRIDWRKFRALDWKQ